MAKCGRSGSSECRAEDCKTEITKLKQRLEHAHGIITKMTITCLAKESSLWPRMCRNRECLHFCTQTKDAIDNLMEG